MGLPPEGVARPTRSLSVTWPWDELSSGVSYNAGSARPLGAGLFRSIEPAMKAVLKSAARVALHQMGGVAALRRVNRRRFGVLMFHSFGEAERGNVEAFCEHITRYFEPVPLSKVAEAMDGKGDLPDNAVAVTVDDGYRNFLEHGHPVFRKHGIPTTLYVVSGFADGRLWLWTDRVAYALENSPVSSIRTVVGGVTLNLPLGSAQERAAGIEKLQDALMMVPNRERLRALETLESLCGIEIPPDPPAERAAMSWDELRAVSREGVEVGCHTETHPILSRVEDPDDLWRELSASKREIEEHVGLPVTHFCYPNGRAIDIGEAAIRGVSEAGYASATTCTWGLNDATARRYEIRRLPFDRRTEFRYGVELLAGLHM